MHLYINFPARDFPNLWEDHPVQVGRPTFQYNCYAWAYNKLRSVWLDPTRGPWPCPPSETPDWRSVQNVWQAVGYHPTEHEYYRPGFHTIILYGFSHYVLHAARFRPDGWVESKLGGTERIKHKTVKGLVGPFYGDVLGFLARPYYQKWPSLTLKRELTWFPFP
jgi:hypothetical protein